MVKRKPNPFEMILLGIGIALIVIGYISIHRMILIEKNLSWDLIQAVFLWLLMILMVISAAVNENMKEELKVMIENQVEEIKLLRYEVHNK
ncbi:hypothetical protein KY358_03770 [Candidatus Woesearchaeota archaeon]|nr:hypothetical protein [Candidatus Woesearchaeota archaeon]